MNLPFVKMHGIGNDYVFVDCFSYAIANPALLARIVSDRHFGIGADGLVLISPSEHADAAMRMFNADGSEGLMCGNALRCIGRYLYESGTVKKPHMFIDTASGRRRLRLIFEEGCIKGVAVDMGFADFWAPHIPVIYEQNEMVDAPLTVENEEYRVTCLSMGNPHCVIFCDNPDNVALHRIGPLFERHAAFPERVNTEFVRVIDRFTVCMRVYERGSGETLACGSGACAAVAAAVRLKLCASGQDVTVKLRGGQLTVNCRRDGPIWMTGPAVRVFDGVLHEACAAELPLF